MGKRQILVVEDDGIVARDIQNSLKKLGFDVCASVPSGEEALEEAEEQKPDLVLMDIMLKGKMNGTEAAQQIRSRFDIPVVYLTAYADEEILERAKVTEPFGYIIKPFEERELYITIEMGLYRHKMEKKLKESEERYRTIIENIVDGYYEVDLAGNLTFFNDALCHMTGYPRDELMGMNNRQYMDEGTAKRAYQVFNRVYNTNKPVKGFEYEITPLNYGSKRAVESSVSLIRGPGDEPIGFRGVLRDITERKKTEKVLQESKANLDKAQEIAHVGSWRGDLNRDQGYWSDEMYRILGLTPGDPETPSREDLLSRVHPEDRERTALVIKKAVKKKESFDFEFRTIPIEGSERIVHAQGEVVCDETGASVIIFGTNQDVTETRKLQDQLQEGQKMEAIATLAGGIAHQFNNALSSITGYTGFLEMDYPQDEKITEYTGAMKQSAHRMAHLTNQLLAYARGGKYQSRDLKLDDFMIETLPILQHDLNPTVRVETHFPKVSYIRADHTQMQMVLSAILANSNEAMEDEGLIKITAENKNIDEDFTKQHHGLKPGPYVCLTIEDDGKGMSEEERKKIFDPFFTSKFQGRGMGMAAVYGIIKSHDGAITVESESGKGTVVRIYLPAISAESGEQRAKAVKQPEIEIAMGEGTILVIEDEEPLVKTFRKILERLGYRVLEARTGKEAVEFAKTFDGQIDLALLDIKLPDMEGGRVYPLIMGARPDLKVIVCSGYSIHGPAQDILDAGAEGFIQKPFWISEFSEKLKEVLEGK